MLLILIFFLLKEYACGFIVFRRSLILGFLLRRGRLVSIFFILPDAFCTPWSCISARPTPFYHIMARPTRPPPISVPSNSYRVISVLSCSCSQIIVLSVHSSLVAAHCASLAEIIAVSASCSIIVALFLIGIITRLPLIYRTILITFLIGRFPLALPE